MADELSDFERDVILPKALALVWGQYDPHRYQPRAIGAGPGWEVWDSLEDRAVSVAELVQLTPEQVQQKITN